MDFDSNGIFFTADTHFFHENIIGYANRPFSCIEEMNEVLISNWNETVPLDGIVFHLGDFCFGGTDKWLSVLSRLNGRKYLVPGNHDMRHLKGEILARFEAVSGQMDINVDGQRIVLTHNPFSCPEGANQYAWHLFGHIHSGPLSIGNGKDDDKVKDLLPTQYDVGVDNNCYRPVSFARVREIIELQKQLSLSGFR